MYANNWFEESRRFYQRGAEKRKKVCIIDADKLYICHHHLSKIGRIFEEVHKIHMLQFVQNLQVLKDAIRFHYSWQPNLLTTDMIVSLVGSYLGHAMILHKKLRRMLAMKCCNLSMNHCKLICWILRQPIIQPAKMIQMKQENNQERIEQRSSVYWRYTHQNTQHARVSYVNEKL